MIDWGNELPLILLSLAWISGIFFGSLTHLNIWLAIAGLFPLPAVGIFPKHRKPLFLLAGGIILFIAGNLYFRLHAPDNDAQHLLFYNDQAPVKIEASVIRDPEWSDKTIQLLVSASIVNETKDVSGRAIIIIPRAAVDYAYAYGDRLSINGQLETPPSFDGFDYGRYLAGQGIYSVMYSPEIKLLDTGGGFKPLALVYQLRNKLSQSLSRTLPEPQASLAQGIILGQRSGIPAEIKIEFNNTGTTHLLAISGVNLTIMAGVLVSLGIALFGRRHQIYAWLAIVSIWLYALLTGFQPPVVRAAIMATVFLVTELLGRQRSAVIALVLSVTLMLSISPRIFFDASFQLSVMAMVGLMFVAPPLQSAGKRAIEGALPAEISRFCVPIADSLLVSLGSIIAVWPLIAVYFGIVSWVGPVATLFAATVMPAIIITGSLCAFLGVVWLPLALAAAWFVWLLLSYVLLVIKIADYVPFSQVRNFSLPWIFAYYFVLGLVIIALSHKSKLQNYWNKFSDFTLRLPAKQITGSLSLCAVLVFAAVGSIPDDKLHVAFLDVGQGDAVLISQGSRQILLDGGPSSGAIASQLGRHMPFWDRTIDILISTHPHSDHLGGLVEVLKRYEVKQVLYADIDYTTPQATQWKTLISQKNISSTKALSGQQITFGDAKISVLNPQPNMLSGTGSDVDNNGIVTRLELGVISFLFMADTRYEAELQLAEQRLLLPSTVLKVGHHGSVTSTTEPFLSVVKPDVAVISVGNDNVFGHPDKWVLQRLAEKTGEAGVYRTDLQGTIVFITDGQKLWVKTDR